MFIHVCNTDINYTVEGTGKDIILLHGWGQNIAMMQPLADFLKNTHRVWIIDLPGMAGASPEPPYPWDIYDYTTMLHEFIIKNNIQNPSLCGHSFGGRMSIIYAAKHASVEKVVLMDAAGIIPKRGIDYYAKVYAYKLGKFVKKIPGIKQLTTKAQSKAGSEDYQNASEVMKQVLTKVVNQDLSEHFAAIKAPTLLIWGEQDEATPLSDAQRMEKEIANAALISFPNAGHYAYLEELPQVRRILESFFASN